MNYRDYSTRVSLIQRLKDEERNEQDWEDFVLSYKNYIHSIIYFFKLSPNLQEDLCQEALLQIYKDLPKYEYRPNQCKFRTWLSLVTRNVVKTYLKSKANKNNKKNVEFEEAIHALDAITEPEIDQISEKEWKVFIMEKALANLKTRISAKVMTTLEASLNQKPDSEVAEELNTTPGSIRVYRQRGMTALKKEVHRLNAELEL